ncbi:MAG TPA: SDR family NAD(P)-dependent oxidoreductase, partial [Nitrospiraceae bacterium]
MERIFGEDQQQDSPGRPNDKYAADNIHERIPMKLINRTILITGGSTGIGLAFARKFLELGNQVIVTGRRQSVLDELKADYPKLHTIQSDVADPAQIAALAKRVKAEFPKLDVLMNNAGIMHHKNLKLPAADLDG